jgi:uncharacterized protein YjdB
LHEYSCLSNMICSNIRMKVTSSAPAPTNNDCANATILAVNPSCLLTSGTTSGATEDPILDPSCDPGSINDVWYTFNSGANTSVNVTVNLGTASLVGIEIFSACGTLAPGISLGGALGNCDFNTSAPNPTVITGLTPNTNYRFRLFTNVTYDIAGSFTVCLTVPPPPPAPTVSINSASICPGASTTLTATPSTLGGTYLWSPGGQTTQSITVSPLTTTTYSVTYTLNGVGTNNSTVTVYSPPAINAGLDISICSGQPATLTGSGGVSYTWNNGVTNNLAFNPLTTATYTVTGTDLNGCIGTDQMTLTVNANPTLSGNTVICPNATSQLTGSGIAATSNAWVSSNAAVATVSTTGLVSALSFGTAIVTYTNNNGCSATSTINVSNPTAPTFNPVAAVCTGGAIVLPIISSNGIQGTWSPAINNTQTTTYTFTPSAGQCATTAQLSVAVNPNPTISGVTSVCSGGTSQLTGSGTAAANNAWASASAPIASISGTGLVTGASAGTSVVTYTNSNGCSATASVTVNANPIVSGNTVICPSTTSQLLGSGTAAANNAWTSSNPAVATVSTTGLVSALSFGTAIITYTNNNGCSATSTINVSNPTAPTFNPVAAVCSGGAILLPIISSNGIQGTWSPAINNTQTTTYTFTPSTGQCATTAQLSVAVNPNPIISGGTSVCSGGTSQLTGSGTAAANNAWTSANTSIASISGTGLVTGTSAGTAVVTYTNSNGCSAIASVTVNANPIVSGNTVICPNTTSQLIGSGTAAAWTSSNTAVATVSTTGLVSALSFGTAIITYTNNLGCSTTITITVSNPTAPTFNPVAAVCTGGAIVLPSTSNNSIQGTWSPAINNTQTTTYTFTPSAGQCATTAQLSVAVNPNPTISGGTAVCSGGTLQLTGSGTAAANNAWSSASTAIASISGTGLVTGTSAGTSVVTYTNSNGCLATASVTVNANPTANAGLDITTCVGGNVTLSGTATNGAAPYTYSWNNSVQNGVPFVALTNSTYTLSVSDGNGCTNTDQMTLTTNSINWANLQFPASGNICLGQSHTIYGQIYVAGVTNGPGQAAGVVAQAGLNASNTDPSTWPLSAWSAATFNVQQGNNDEYMASVGQLQAAGTYYYTYRYSLGAGCPYFYAGINGAWNGTSNTNGSLVINNAPNATINQSACASYSWYGQNYTQSGTYTQTVPSGAGCDSVLYLNLTIHQPVTGPSTQQTACETYTWNGQTYTQSGSYTFNGTTQYGCDSTVTLNLVIDALPSNLNVTLSGGTFTATASNVSNYSWIDCATNTSIPFQNAATFTPTSSGSYAVVVSNNCGADTSTCEPIEVNGLSDAVLPIINVYPNPSSGIFNVFSEMEITFLEILDLKGAVVYNSKPNDNLATIDLRFQADGIYVLKLRTPQNTSYFRIVKN